MRLGDGGVGEPCGPIGQCRSEADRAIGGSETADVFFLTVSGLRGLALGGLGVHAGWVRCVGVGVGVCDRGWLWQRAAVGCGSVVGR